MGKQPGNILTIEELTQQNIKLEQQNLALAAKLRWYEEQFIRFGVELSRQTMANWVLHCANTWLAPLYEQMKVHLLKQDIAYADETTLQVLREPRRVAESKS